MTPTVLHEKACRECGQVLPIEQFSRHPHSADGLQDRCRGCFSRYNAARYAADRDRFKEAVAAYKDANPEQVFVTRLKTWRKKPTRQNVYKLVEAAINAGVIVRAERCSVCGVDEPSSGGGRLHKHHFDYSEPLSVVWLCAKCHGQIHKLIRERREAC